MCGCGMSECGVCGCGMSECGVSGCGMSECGVSGCGCKVRWVGIRRNLGLARLC